MMEIIDPQYLNEQYEEYITSAGNSPEEILRKVRYTLHTPEGENILAFAKRVFERLPKIYQKYPNKI